MNFVVVVWGELYTSLYLDFVLPNHLSPNNREALSKNKDRVCYQIYTLTRNIARIEQSESYLQLNAVVTTEIVPIDDCFHESGNTYSLVTKIHCLSIEKAESNDAAIVFLTPDLVWNDGAFGAIFRIADQGKRAIFVNCISAISDQFKSEYIKTTASDAYAGIHSRQLVKLAIDHMHPANLTRYWHRKNFTACPAHIYWEVKGEGLVSKAFHLHPLMVYPEHKSERPDVTMDYDWVHKACPDIGQHYVVTDSDEIFGAEFRPPSEPLAYANALYQPPRFVSVAHWAHKNVFSDHRNNFRHVIKIHYSDGFSRNWNVIERAVEEATRCIDVIIPLPFIFHLLRRYLIVVAFIQECIRQTYLYLRYEFAYDIAHATRHFFLYVIPFEFNWGLKLRIVELSHRIFFLKERSPKEHKEVVDSKLNRDVVAHLFAPAPPPPKEVNLALDS